jgi:plasmid stabilization system protein ParE
MNKAVIVADKAAAEILKASLWYDAESVELNRRFVKELEYHFNRIKTYPDMYKKVDKDIFRCLMKIFPYVIFFTKINNDIVILRIRHKKQRPLKKYK